MKYRHALVLSTLACVGLSTVSLAADTPATNAATPTGQHQMRHGPMHVGMHGPMMDGPFMHVIHKLNLSAEQKQSIHSLLDSQHAQSMAAMSTMRANMEALANPGDPNYPAAVATAKTNAANMIQQRSDLEVQIYALLTNEQKAELPKVLADMKTKHAEHGHGHAHGPAPAKTN